MPPMACRSALILIALGAVLVKAQTADDVVRETQRLKSQTDQEKRLASTDSARQAEWRVQGKERLATMRAEAARLGRERDSLRRYVDHRLSAPPPPPPTASGVVRRKAFAAAVATRIDALLPRISPSDDGAASHADLQALSRSLKAGTADASEGLARLFDAWAESVDGAARLTARTGTNTTIMGRSIRGTYLSVGGGFEAFVDNQGEYSVTRARGTTSWLSSFDSNLTAALFDAAKKVSGKGEPGWAWLPASPGWLPSSKGAKP